MSTINKGSGVLELGAQAKIKKNKRQYYNAEAVLYRKIRTLYLKYKILLKFFFSSIVQGWEFAQRSFTHSLILLKSNEQL